MSLYMIIENGQSNWIAVSGKSRRVVTATEADWIFYLVKADLVAV